VILVAKKKQSTGPIPEETKETAPPHQGDGQGSTVKPTSILEFGPFRVLTAAIRAVPSVKYALGVAGIVSVIAIVASMGIDLRIALAGSIIMLFLMTALVVFAKLTTTAAPAFRWPIFLLLWSSILLTIATAILLFTSVFFGVPLELRHVFAFVGQPDILSLPNSDYIEIPESKLLGLKAAGTFSNHLEITDVVWDRQKSLLDVKVRNKTDDSLVITMLALTFYHKWEGAPLLASGKHDFVKDNAGVQEATKHAETFRCAKGYKVSYVVPARGADRYLFAFGLRPENLYYPKSQPGGFYELGITFCYNDDRKTSDVVSLNDLIAGRFRRRD
jgi:hypothetical protein